MFDKLKGLAGNASKLWEMKKKFEEMKKALDAMIFTEEDRNVKVTVNGSQELKEVDHACATL